MTEEYESSGESLTATPKQPATGDEPADGAHEAHEATGNKVAPAQDSRSPGDHVFAINGTVLAADTDVEDGPLSPSSATVNETALSKASAEKGEPVAANSGVTSAIGLCSNPARCVTLTNILDSFKAPLSEEQAWALIFQFVLMYRKVAATAAGAAASGRHIFSDLEIPDTADNLNLHGDGSVHCSLSEAEREAKERQHREQANGGENGENSHALLLASHRKVLRKVAVIVFTALDYNSHADEQCQMSPELEELITHMTADEADEDCIDEGIDEGYKRWEDESEDDKCNQTKEFDYVLEVCRSHVKPTVPEDHYRAVCRALVTETIELRIFLQQVLHDGADDLHVKADSQRSQQELAKLGFNDWARFWVQVIDELRRGVRLKKNNYSRTPIEYELTPYEILMEDIRSKKYQLRKVMVNGDIPPRVKKDAHALILEFIRSRPPLKKASERKLPPPIKRTPSPREQLMDSIRKGRTLKHIQPPSPPRLRDRLLPSTTSVSSTTSASASASAATHHRSKLGDTLKLPEDMEPHTTPRSKQRLIKVDFSLLQDDDTFFDESCLAPAASSGRPANVGVCSQPKMPPYPIGGYMVHDAMTMTSATKATPAPQPPPPAPLTTRVTRRTTYDLATTQCDSRRASSRRHTIVGCQSNMDDAAPSMPASSRPASRQSDVDAAVGADDGSTVKQLHNNYNQQQQQQQQQRRQHRQQHQQQQQQQMKRSQSPSDESENCSRSSSSLGRPWNKSFLDEKTWSERGDDRLSLTLEEIVHIRSVMTKAELEGLPVGVRVKEDVEKRKVCFLCLRTRFSIFGPWGIQCKLCQRTVCSKCYTKMRIPSEHFRNVPLVLISPSLLASPASSSSPSPSHHGHHGPGHSSSTGNILDETFPKSLIERLLGSEMERKARNSVGSAPSSPKHQRSNMSTPGVGGGGDAAAAGQAVEALCDSSSRTTGTSRMANGSYSGAQSRTGVAPAPAPAPVANNKHYSIMSRSMEGPRSLPAHSPARPHSNSSTLDRKSTLSRAFALSSSGTQLSQEQKENLRGEQVPVCNDCKGLVMEISRSAKQKRSSARNRTLQNLTLDLSPVWK